MSALVFCACEDGSSVSGASLGTGNGQGGTTNDGGTVGGSDGKPTAEVTIVGGDATTSADGATIVPGEDAIAGQDVPATGGDGGQPAQDIVPVDPSVSCMGKCGQAQPNKWKCQCDTQCAKYNDCCGDYADVCKAGPGPGTDPAAIIGCLEKSCADTVAACKANGTCAQFWDCASACKDSNCMQACSQKFDLSQLGPVLTPMQDCGQKAGCFGGGGPGPGNGPVCGDGKCEQPENSLNCAKDCPNTPPGDAQKCLYDKCKDSYNACFGSQPCVAAVACINTGKPANQCASDKKTAEQLNAMLQCGDKNGCFGGGSTGAQCGNGKCEAGETYLSCAKDCPAPPPPTDALTKCVADKCQKSYAACVANDGCAKALACVGAGGNMQQCAQQAGGGTNALLTLGQCAYQNGCLTDTGGGTTDTCKGKCGQYTPNAKCQCNTLCKQFGNCCADYDTQCGGATTGGSCAGKCGTFTPGASCQCNTDCATFKNCCGDYNQVCSTTPPTPVCGDGICTAPTESSTSCPKDCGAPPAKACKSKADCADTEICCGKADGTQSCLPAGQCK